jgi:hypothetical protein
MRWSVGAALTMVAGLSAVAAAEGVTIVCYFGSTATGCP